MNMTSAPAIIIQAVSPVSTLARIERSAIAQAPTGVTAPVVGLAGADAHRALEVDHEDLAVAHLAGAAAVAERVDRRLDEGVGDRDLEANLLGEAHLHGGAAVGLDPLELTAVPLDTTHRYPPHLGAIERLEDVVRLLGANDPDHQLQCSPFPSRGLERARAYPRWQGVKRRR